MIQLCPTTYLGPGRPCALTPDHSGVYHQTAGVDCAAKGHSLKAEVGAVTSPEGQELAMLGPAPSLGSSAKMVHVS
jgi:hypothetical protein